MHRWLSALVLCGLTACAEPEQARWVRLFEPATLPLQLPEKIVRDWQFDDAQAWTPVDDTPYRLLAEESPGGLWVGWINGRASLETRTDFAADEVDALEVELAYPHGTDLELAWRCESDENGYSTVQIASLDADDKKLIEGNAIYRFELRDRASWIGTIRSLRLRLRASGGEGRAVLAITALRLDLAESLWSEWAETPWRIELDNEVRDALLAPPGGILEREVVATRGSSLEVGFGTIGIPRQPLYFRVYAEQDGARSELLAMEIPASTAPKWIDRVLDLSGLSGNLRIVFEVRGQSSLSPRTGLPVWSTPTLESPRSREPNRLPDIVMISIDTLRADRLESSAGATPVANAIAEWGERQAVRFANPIVQASWTLPSHSSMLTGLEATHHAVNYPYSFLPGDRSTLAEQLRRVGYRTQAITGGGWLHARFGLDQGFDRFRYWPRRTADGELEQGVRRALAALESSGRPLFLFLHTFAVHEYWRNLPGGAERGAVGVRGGIYDDAVERADRLLRPLLERLSELADERPLMVVLTSDHGESLGDPFAPGHGDPVEETIRVPLLLQLPSLAGAGTVIADQVRTIDLVPTILDVIGHASSMSLDGASLLPLLDPRSPRGKRPAWTYSPAGNAGLSLRMGNRWKYRLQNAAGHDEARRGQLWQLDGQGGEHKIDAADEHLDEFERRSRALLAATPGLHIEISPPAGHAIQLELDGLGYVLNLHAVKSLDLPRGSLSRLAPDRLRLAIPTGGTYSLVLEHLSEPRLAIAIGGSESLTWRLVLELADTALELHFAPSGETWRSVVRPSHPGLEIRWVPGGSSLALSTHRPPGTPALHRRLKALGYLD